jgi:hypothetical protein
MRNMEAQPASSPPKCALGTGVGRRQRWGGGRELAGPYERGGRVLKRRNRYGQGSKAEV